MVRSRVLLSIFVFCLGPPSTAAQAGCSRQLSSSCPLSDEPKAFRPSLSFCFFLCLSRVSSFQSYTPTENDEGKSLKLTGGKDAVCSSTSFTCLGVLASSRPSLFEQSRVKCLRVCLWPHLTVRNVPWNGRQQWTSLDEQISFLYLFFHKAARRATRTSSNSFSSFPGVGGARCFPLCLRRSDSFLIFSLFLFVPSVSPSVHVQERERRDATVLVPAMPQKSRVKHESYAVTCPYAPTHEIIHTHVQPPDRVRGSVAGLLTAPFFFSPPTTCSTS